MLEVNSDQRKQAFCQSMEDEMTAVAMNRGTKDSEEGMRAFMEKRTSVFNRLNSQADVGDGPRLHCLRALKTTSPSGERLS